MFDQKEYNKKRYLEKREYILNQRKEYYKNYKLEIICECETREEAYETEYQLIIKHNPKYNVNKYRKYT